MPPSACAALRRVLPRFGSAAERGAKRDEGGKRRDEEG